MDETLNDISIDEMGNVDLSGVDFSAYENMDFSTTGLDTTMMMDPSIAATLGVAGTIINILSIILYISGAYGLYLINKKLGEKHAWLSFVPILQIYNYFTASQKSFVKYLLIPFIVMILGIILGIILGGIISGVVTPILGVLVMIASYVYFFVMWIKVLHAISLRTGNGVWTTVGFIFVSFIMFPIVGIKMKDKSNDEAFSTENNPPVLTNKSENEIEL
ncbi:hypothetical protein HUU51_01495 [Candidatus Gracilibacteria bacterium]|nr:hypothetical protein [Candidatus Gracilibacteria bacterium]